MNADPAVRIDDGLEIDLAATFHSQAGNNLEAQRECILLILDVGYARPGESRFIFVNGVPDVAFDLMHRLRIGLQEIEEIRDAVIVGDRNIALAGVEYALQVGQHRVNAASLVVAPPPQRFPFHRSDPFQ